MIQKFENDFLEAMRPNDLTCLNKIFSEKYVFLSSDGSTWGKDKAIEDYKHPQFQLSKIEIHNRRITMHENSAIVTGISVVEGSIGEEFLAGRYQFMRVCNNGEEGWKIIAVLTLLLQVMACTSQHLNSPLCSM